MALFGGLRRMVESAAPAMQQVAGGFNRPLSDGSTAFDRLAAAALMAQGDIAGGLNYRRGINEQAMRSQQERMQATLDMQKAEDDRLAAEEQARVRDAALRNLIGDNERLSAFVQAFPDQAGALFSESLKPRNANAGDLFIDPVTNRVVSVPSFTSINDQRFADDPLTGTSRVVATAAPAYSDLTARMQATTRATDVAADNARAARAAARPAGASRGGGGGASSTLQAIEAELRRRGAIR